MGGRGRPMVLVQVVVVGRVDRGGPTSLGVQEVWPLQGVAGVRVHVPTFRAEGVSCPSDCVGGAPLGGPSPTGRVTAVVAAAPTGHVTQEGVSARLPTGLVGVQEAVPGGLCPVSPPTDHVTCPAAVVAAGGQGVVLGVSSPSPSPTAAHASPVEARGEVQEGVPARPQTPIDHHGDALPLASGPHVDGLPCRVTPHVWTGGYSRRPPCWSRHPGGPRSPHPPSPRWQRDRATGGCSRRTPSQRQRPDCRVGGARSGLGRGWGAGRPQTQHSHLCISRLSPCSGLAMEGGQWKEGEEEDVKEGEGACPVW